MGTESREERSQGKEWRRVLAGLNAEEAGACGEGQGSRLAGVFR